MGEMDFMVQRERGGEPARRQTPAVELQGRRALEARELPGDRPVVRILLETKDLRS